MENRICKPRYAHTFVGGSYSVAQKVICGVRGMERGAKGCNHGGCAMSTQTELQRLQAEMEAAWEAAWVARDAAAEAERVARKAEKAWAAARGEK